MSEGIGLSDVLGWEFQCPAKSVALTIAGEELRRAKEVERFNKRYVEMRCPACGAKLEFRRCAVNGATHFVHIGSA